MVERSAQFLLRDIVFYGDRLASHVHGRSYDEYQESTLLQDAVAYCIMIVGEASAQLLSGTDDPSRYEGLELRQARAMRNVLIHGYAGTELDLVWDTATTDLPRITARARRLVGR